MTTYQCEQVSDVLEDIKPLLVMHWAEIAHYEDIKLNPDWEWYQANPAVRVYTAREGRQLIGYGVFFLTVNRHYKQSVYAVQDLFFVDPAHRGSVGYRLIKFCEQQAKAEGAQVIYERCKHAHSSVFAPLLERTGYELIDYVYAKRLDKE